MTIKVAQSAESEDSAHWRWAVWIEGSAEELNNVKEVVWTLHPTFSPPVHTTKSRSDNFKLEAGGWGEFEVRAKVVGEDGRSKRLRHWLVLQQDGQAAPRRSSSVPKGRAKAVSAVAGGQPARVFLSYPVSNASLAAQLAEALKGQQHEVTRDIDIPAGVDFRAWSQEQVARSDAVVLLGADDISMSRCPEIKVAQAEGVPIIPVAFSGKSLPGLLGDVEPVRIKASSSEQVVQQVVTALGRRLG